jgi:hypothetical protein
VHLGASSKPIIPTEIFGIATGVRSPEALRSREQKKCPHTNSRCTKSGKKDPLGICSFGQDSWCTPVCPKRLLEEQRVFKDAADIAFGKGNHRLTYLAEVGVIEANPKIIAECESDSPTGVDQSPSGKKYICKIDYVVVQTAADSDESITNYFGLELQSVYFSGGSMREHLASFLSGQTLAENSARRMDWRSSAQKRLVPQLRLKVAAFKKLDKKLFVAVEKSWFDFLPNIPEVERERSDLIFLVYPFDKRQEGYRMGDPRVAPVQWQAVEKILREGNPPKPEDFTELLRKKLQSKARKPKSTARKGRRHTQ